MSFTPLVSPAVTPLDTQFPVEAQQYTVPGAYFSPLSSPALQGQNEPNQMYAQRHSGMTVKSPVDMDLDSPSAAPTSVDMGRRARKANAAATAKAKAKT